MAVVAWKRREGIVHANSGTGMQQRKVKKRKWNMEMDREGGRCREHEEALHHTPRRGVERHGMASSGVV